jgi:DNA-binding response OmpR family regulator
MKKILIVEDDPKIAFGLCVRLKANGYITWVAEDAITALRLTLSHKPDLIVLDISLPAGNGLTLAERLCELPEACETPIIIATGSADPRLSEKALEIGAVALLRKPYHADTLLMAARQALALSERRPHAVAPAGRLSPPPGKGERKRVLIVEDDEKVAKALALRIQAAGFDTSVATDGLSGVRCAVETRPDAVVLDISLPAGDGFSVAERIRANVATPVPLIFLTASKRQEFRQRAHQLGAAGFFEKPYQPEALLAAINQATRATAA